MLLRCSIHRDRVGDDHTLSGGAWWTGGRQTVVRPLVLLVPVASAVYSSVRGLPSAPLTPTPGSLASAPRGFGVGLGMEPGFILSRDTPGANDGGREGFALAA